MSLQVEEVRISLPHIELATLEKATLDRKSVV